MLQDCLEFYRSFWRVFEVLMGVGADSSAAAKDYGKITPWRKPQPARATTKQPRVHHNVGSEVKMKIAMVFASFLRSSGYLLEESEPSSQCCERKLCL